MNPDSDIRFHHGRLRIGGLDAAALAATVGTPAYVYSAADIRARYREIETVFAPLNPLICYALKASGNIHLCRMLGGLGAGMDVVSGGELERAWLADVPMQRITFAGVGKTEHEIAAALDGRHSPLKNVGGLGTRNPIGRGTVGRFNIESSGEAERIERIATDLGVVASGSVRINPDVDAFTHAYTTTGKHENKFGIDIPSAEALFERFKHSTSLRLQGLHVHLGSPIATPRPFVEGITEVLKVRERLERSGHAIREINIGGGFGIDYGRGKPSTLAEFAVAIVPLLRPLADAGVRILLEPGRPIVGNAGMLLTRVQYVKHGPTKRFVVCDSGVHHLIRPALYGAYHFIWPVECGDAFVPTGLGDQPHEGLVKCDVVGPVCESSDFLAKDRQMPEVPPGAVLAVFSAGAYGMSMASTYNDHPKPIEVMVDGDSATIIRPRQTIGELIASELGEPRRV